MEGIATGNLLQATGGLRATFPASFGLTKGLPLADNLGIDTSLGAASLHGKSVPFSDFLQLSMSCAGERVELVLSI